MIRIEHILCPVDFFPASNLAADYSIALARNYEARLTLFHVVSPVMGAAYEIPLNVEEVVRSMTASAEAELKKIASKAESKGVQVSSLTRVGDIDFEILSAVKNLKANMVVMGTHSRNRLEQWFLGSHTERLLRQIPVPLLTIGKARHKAAPPEIRKILLTTDFSDGTADALSYAFSIAQECQARLTLLHVIDDVTAGTARYRDPLIRSVRAELEKFIPSDVRDWCEVSTRVQTGLPLKVILDRAKRDGTDLIVMNIHGKGMLDRALLGSTAERVVRGAECPVLLVPPIVKRRRKKGPAVKEAIA